MWGLCSVLVLLVSCVDGQQLAQNQNLPKETQTAIKRGNITQAVNSLTDPPKANCPNCTTERTSTRSTGLYNWETYKKNSRTSVVGGVPTDTTPYGKVQWFNGTKRSVPGGGGMRGKGSSYLDRSMLDILPYIAMAHNDLGIPTRIAHSVDGTHSANSLHYSGRALDIDPMPDSKRRAAYNKIIEKLRNTKDPSTGKPIGCGYFVYDEHSHIHVSYKGPGYGGCPGSKIK